MLVPFIDRDALRLAISGAGRREDHAANTGFDKSAKQTNALFQVILVIKRRLRDRLTHVRKRGEVDARFDIVFAGDPFNQLAVADAPLVKRRLGRDGLPVSPR